MVTKGLFIYTETSLHAGVGSTVSAIDLPIQRERTTVHREVGERDIARAREAAGYFNDGEVLDAQQLATTRGRDL